MKLWEPCLVSIQNFIRKKNETFCIVITVCVLQKHAYKIYCSFLKLFALFQAGTEILGNTLNYIFGNQMSFP